MSLDQILGWTATAIFTITYVPQIMKTVKSKTVDGLSFMFLLLPWVGNIVALCYATMIHQKPLQIKYTLALILLSVSIFCYLRVKYASRTK